LLAHRAEVGQAEPGQRLLAQLVALAEQLVAAADGEEDCAVVDRLRKRRALGLDHVGGDGALVAVLAAADVEEVVRARIDRLALAGAVVDEADPAPFAAPPQKDDVAAVGVDVHLVGVEPEDAKLHHSSWPRTTTVEPTWSSVGSIWRRSTATRPTSAASASSSSAVIVQMVTESGSSVSSPLGETRWRSRWMTMCSSSISASSGRLEETHPST